MSTDNGPPSSQSINYSRIFVYQSDDPIPVFVEASSIRNRPKLIRSLRNSGALICHGPAQAHVILVDSTTDPGIQFIRDWGTDPAKFVLEYSWARKCVEAGRPLLQNDNWGDCVARDDGRSISGTNEGEISIAKSPLPTPRPTPSDAGPSSTKHDFGQSARPKFDAVGGSSSKEDARLKNTESSPSQSASQIQMTPQASENLQPQQGPSQQMIQAQQFPHPASQSQQFPYPQPVSQPQQFQPQLFSQYPQSQQSQSNSFSNNTGIQYSNPYIMNSNPQFPQIQPGQNMVYPPQMVQNYIGGHQNGTYDAQMFLATLMDVARQQGLPIPLGVPQPMGNAMFQQQIVQPQQFQNSDLPAQPQAQSISSSLSHSLAHPDSSPHLSASVPSHSASPEVCAPSIRRRSLLPSTPSPPPPPSRSKGKRKAVVSRQISFKRKRSESSSDGSSDESSEGESYATPPRLSQAKEPHVLSPRKLGEIFRSDSGESLLFFVQVDLMGRQVVAQNIKKNGGKLGGSISEADFVVLGNSQSKTFPDLLAQTTTANKLPLRSSFITDCVKHEALLEISDYVLEEYRPPKKRGRPNVPTSKAETPKNGEAKKKKKATSKRNMNRPVAQIHFGGAPSPSPPPISARIELPGGNFRFTDEEIDFFRRYVRHLVEKDYLINNAAIFKRLHDKIPHHSSNSWQQYIRRVFPDDMDTIRKKVGVARRKAADFPTNSQTDQDKKEAGPSKSQPTIDYRVSIIDATVHRDSEQLDFEDICRFFAAGGGDNSDDEAVWASLASHQPCRSAASWPEFYQSQEVAIAEEIERLIEESTAVDAGGAHPRS